MSIFMADGPLVSMQFSLLRVKFGRVIRSQVASLKCSAFLDSSLIWVMCSTLAFFHTSAA